MEEYLDLGARYMNDLNYEDAIVAFQKAVDIDPRNKEAATFYRSFLFPSISPRKSPFSDSFQIIIPLFPNLV